MNLNCHRIISICSLIRGTSPTMKTLPGEYPLVVTADFRRSSDSYQIEGPAVCVPLISSTGHGDAALHRVHYQEGKFALADLLVALLPRNPNVCDAKYLYYLLMAKKNEYLVPLMLGTANVSLKENDIANLEIPLPPIAEQKKTVAWIEELETKINESRELRRMQKDEVDQMLLGAFDRAASGAPRLTMRDVAPQVRRPVKVELPGAYPELGIRSFGKGTFHKSALSGAEIGNKRIFKIDPGDLVFSNVFAWEGAIAVAKPEDAGRVGSHRYITCVPKSGVLTSSFLCFYFLTPEGLEQIGRASPGGAGRNRTLGLAALDAIKVPVPHFAQQQWFDSLQTEVDSFFNLQNETAVELDALSASILNRAFKGEL